MDLAYLTVTKISWIFWFEASALFGSIEPTIDVLQLEEKSVEEAAGIHHNTFNNINALPIETKSKVCHNS